MVENLQQRHLPDARGLRLTSPTITVQYPDGFNTSFNSKQEPVMEYFLAEVGEKRLVDKSKLKRLEARERASDRIKKFLERVVIGQPKACEVIANQVALAEAGLNDPGKPLGVFYFSGPSGVGKTEAGRALALYLSECSPEDDSRRLERLKVINMGEYQDKIDVRRFIGAPQAYVGAEEDPVISHAWLNPDKKMVKNEKGEYVEILKPKKSVIIFDDAHNAYEDIFGLFLSMIDEGRFDSRNGPAGFQPLDFTNAYLIFTTNDGATELQKAHDLGGGMGIQGSSSKTTREQIAETGFEAVKQRFKSKPEFLTRIPSENFIVFQHLSDSDLRKVVEKVFAQRNKKTDTRNIRLGKMGFTPTVPLIRPSDSLIEYILSQTDNSAQGRQIGQRIQNIVYSRLADVLAKHDNLGNKTVYADYENGEVVFYQDTSDEICYKALSQTKQSKALTATN